MKLRRASIFTKIVIAALIVYAGISLMNLKTQVTQARSEQAALQEQVDEATRVNAELEYNIAHSGDAETIEEIARNKLGLVMPGEKVFYDVSN